MTLLPRMMFSAGRLRTRLLTAQRVIYLFCAILLFAIPTTARAEILYASDGNGPLYEIDTVAQTATQVGNGSWTTGPELAADPNSNHLIHSARGDLSSNLEFIDPVTGANLGSPLTMTGFPAGTNTATALEMIGTTLYGSFHQNFTETGAGVLGSIDLTTGAITTIGTNTGMVATAGGLADADGTVYAVSASNGALSELYTIDLATGAATFVAQITISGSTTVKVSGLAYQNGTMYALRSGGGGGPVDTNLYSIDLSTGVMSLEFDMGVPFNSLASSIPQCTFTGDANDDGVFDNLDIAAFVMALTNLKAYQAMYPGVDPDVELDMNCDGDFNNQDIAAFVAALTGS